MPIAGILGPSGSGKSTLLRNLIERVAGAEPLLDTTTRQPRPTDDNIMGKYEYLLAPEFAKVRRAGGFAEHTYVHGNWYATRVEEIARAIASPNLHLGIFDFEGAHKLFTYLFVRRKKDVIRFFYLYCDDEVELRRRLIARGDTAESITRRLADSQYWNEEAKANSERFTLLDALEPAAHVTAQALIHLRAWHFIPSSNT